ncbi:uncharacterized protein BXZ73DRAFT_77573 [Epithele typhae]|uniref:uncharacterized protein n=1 Tax=Epithele typhae TaxID=378194 RepID=UPI00200795F2|nr:uncharacterized protein BXZ73DRAFT_77573 [Epithele typhae]KAH9932054.1 hypothetical protein BXZ73DRAFT_77573 [Epithele typhae]
MLAFLFALATVSGVARASFTISPAGNTVAQCSSIDLVWTEQHVWVAPNREIAPGDPVLEDLGIINQQFFLWTVDLPVVSLNVSLSAIILIEFKLRSRKPVRSFYLQHHSFLDDNFYLYLFYHPDVHPFPTNNDVHPGDIHIDSSEDWPDDWNLLKYSDEFHLSQYHPCKLGLPSSNNSAINIYIILYPRGPSTGVIAGAAAGGAAFFVALIVGIAVFVCMRKRRREATHGMLVDPFGNEHTTISPNPASSDFGHRPQMKYAPVPLTPEASHYRGQSQDTSVPGRNGESSQYYQHAGNVGVYGDAVVASSIAGSRADLVSNSGVGPEPRPLANVPLSPRGDSLANAYPRQSGLAMMGSRMSESEIVMSDFSYSLAYGSDTGSSAPLRPSATATTSPTSSSTSRRNREVDAGSVHMDAEGVASARQTLPPAYEDLPESAHQRAMQRNVPPLGPLRSWSGSNGARSSVGANPDGDNLAPLRTKF